MRILLLVLLPIGDTLFATPAIHALRRRYPGAQVTALVYPTNAGILRSNPDVDEVLFWPTRQSWPGLRQVLRLFWELRRARFDLAVEFCNYAWWITFLSGIPRRSEMNLPRLWWLVPGAGREWRKRHAVEHYNDAVSRLGIPVEEMALRICPTTEEEERAQSWLDRHRVGPGELLVGIHPGGEGLWGRKQWGPERFARVASGLHDRLGDGVRVVLMGGKDDAPLAAQIAAGTHAHVINATGHTTLGETAALVRKCALFLGNDSSPLHIAAATGTPVVGIYGPTDPRSYRPWVPAGKEGVDYAVVRSPLPCACRFPLVGGITLAEWATCLLCPSLASITPERVLEACLGMLGRSAKRET
ncbi:MAG: glycosyltransferase family 9 protein [Chloroflexia bacterium]